VRRLSERRGPAAEARLLYEETEPGRAAREAQLAQRKLAREAGFDAGGRPTKQDRRALRKLRGY
jgi:ribosome-associated heat shock protein Hsp15